MKVTIVAKGEFHKKQPTGSNVGNREYCIHRILALYKDYKEFKTFILSCDLDRSNQDSLYKHFVAIIKAGPVDK